jgi:hypothetical protein
MNRFFVLGAQDPEMMEIARVLEEQQQPYGWATAAGGKLVHPYNAYEAYGVRVSGNASNGTINPSDEIIFVECRVMGLVAHHRIDHHAEGDPGFGRPPREYLEGSSLGQLLVFLGLEPTPRQRVIAAADHCLTAAYRGECPGVTVEALMDFREESRSKARGIPPEVLRKQVEEAVKVLQSAETMELIPGEKVALLLEEAQAETPEISEASARSAIPFIYVKDNQDGRKKAGIMGASPESIRVWLKTCGLSSTYGDPVRGYAGGYL